MTSNTDSRTAAQLLRQHDRLGKVRRDLVRQGLLNGDATPDQVLEKLREVIPPDMFCPPEAGETAQGRG